MTLDEQIKKVVRHSFWLIGKDNNNPKITITEANITIDVVGSKAAAGKDVAEGLQYAMYDTLKNIAPIDEISNSSVTMNVSYPLYDIRGNEKIEQVITATYSAKTRAEINWDHFSPDNILDSRIAEEVRVSHVLTD